MAYFNHKPTNDIPSEPLFRQPIPLDEPDDDEDELQDWQNDPKPIDPDADDSQLYRRDRARLILGVGDFFGVLAGTVVILLLIAVLISLLNWLRADIDQFLELWR